MNLYDQVIKEVLSLFNNTKLKSLPLETSFKDVVQKQFIFQNDAKVELGENNESVYFMGYTSNKEFVNKDEILLLGDDINSLPKETPFAHLSFFLIENIEGDEQNTYRLLRDIEYSRYKVNIEGYMVRINTNLLKEGARISFDASKKGISFKDVGMSFLNNYKKVNPNIKFVKQIFITEKDFPYADLVRLQKEVESITITLDHILKKLKMDCRTCSFKEICDTVEGMRELHKKELEERK